MVKTAKWGCLVLKTAVCFKCHYSWQTQTNVASRLRCPKCGTQDLIGMRCPGLTIVVCRDKEKLEQAVNICQLWFGEE